MKNKIKVSVIVPVYNVEKYLEKCLNSLVNQTLQDIEIIVVNDGSPDNSQKIIDKFYKKYPNKIKKFVKENGGLSSARNYGINKAVGEYLAFVDSDDYVDIDMYEKMYNRAEDTNSEVVCCPLIKEYLFTNKKEYYKFQNLSVFGKSVVESPEILMTVKSYAYNKIYKTDFWRKFRFEFKNQWFEDSELIYNVLLKANKIEYVNTPFPHYIKERPGAITFTFNEKMYDIFKSCDSIINFYKKENVYDKMCDEIEKLCVMHIFARIVSFKDAKSKKMVKKFINYSFQYLDNHFVNWKTNKQKKDDFPHSTTYYIRNMIKTNRSLLKFILVLPNSIRKFGNKLLLFLKKIYCKIRDKKQKENKQKKLQRYGYGLMSDLNKILDTLNVVYFIDFGTLLGIIRDNKIMDHDLDMDIGIIPDDFSTEEIRKTLESAGFILWKQYFNGNKILEESYLYKGVKFDINYYEQTKNNSKVWLFYRKPGVQYKEGIRNIVEMTYSKITGTKKIKVKNIVVSVPLDSEKLLEEKYGKNWRIPDKNWIYWKNPAAKPIKNIGNFIVYKKF